jgi:Asp-tRNA(Asn)/Glu-tRNA(Gln) amidotransferase A subunit family amidase
MLLLRSNTTLLLMGIAAVAVVLLFSLLRLEESICCESPVLNISDVSYRYEKIDAPIVSGWRLKLLSYALTRTYFIGPILRRKLLLHNRITEIRQLATQVDLPGLIHYPIHRLNAMERKKHDERASLFPAQSLHHLIINGMPKDDGLEDPSVAHTGFSPLSSSRVLKYHRAFLDPTNIITPVTVLHRTLRAITNLQPIYRPFLTWPPSPNAVKEMIHEAELSASRYASNESISIWDGVPVSFKSCIDLKGYVTTSGSQYDEKTRAEAKTDDDLVQIFRSLGAIILPPTQMVEHGVSPVGYNAYFRGPFNPHNASHFSGGSSSGSAVAVALGITPISIGFDGGGSIRTPASFSGVVGLALGYGRAEATSLKFFSSMLKAGPLAETVADAALVYATITTPSRRWLPKILKTTTTPPRGNPDIDDCTATDDLGFYDKLYDGGILGLPQPHLSAYWKLGQNNNPTQAVKRDLDGIKLGVFYPWLNDSEPDVAQACNEAIKTLVNRGAQVIDVSIPHVSIMRLAHALIISAEFALELDVPYHDPMNPEYLEDMTRITVGIGATSTALDILAAEKLRAWLFHYVNTQVFTNQGVDVIITPTVPVTAPSINPQTLLYGESNTVLQTELLKYVFLANFLGLPSISVPLRFDVTSSMPIGIMLTAPQWKEDVLLMLSSFIESDVEFKGMKTRPRDYFDALNGI